MRENVQELFSVAAQTSADGDAVERHRLNECGAVSAHGLAHAPVHDPKHCLPPDISEVGAEAAGLPAVGHRHAPRKRARVDVVRR